MTGYWWECLSCKSKYNFMEICKSKGVAHFIWDVLIPSGWNQDILIKACPKCGENELRITYEFPRTKRDIFYVNHIVGIGPSDEGYVQMLWETYENGNKSNPLVDFKYIIKRYGYGLNKPPLFSHKELAQVIANYNRTTGKLLFNSKL